MSREIDYIELQELADFVRGPFGGSLKKESFVESGYAVYEQQHAINNQFSDIRYFITEEKYQEMIRFAVKESDIIMSCSGTMGKVAIVPFGIHKGIINQALLKITPRENLLSRFLELYMSSPLFQYFLNKDAKGAAIKNVASVKELKKILIPNFSVSEQQQIVEKLDQAFELIDQAKANIEQNIINAKELFQSKLDEVFSQKGDGWVRKKLNEIVTIRPPKKEAKEKISESDKVTFLPMEDLGINQIYVYPKKEKVLDEVYKGYTYFSEGDLLLAKITPCFENGKMGIAKDLVNSIGFGSSEYIVIRNNSEVLTELVYYNLLQDKFREIGKNNMQGAVGHKRVTLDFVENFDIVYPKDKDVQLELVNILQELTSYVEILNSTYTQKLDNLEELRKSILEKAFKGDLTN